MFSSISDSPCFRHPRLSLAVLRRERRRVQRHNRRARNKGLTHSLTLDEWLGQLYADGWTCHHCGGPFQSLDHLLPSSQGGGTEAGNCVPSCLVCNEVRGHVAHGLMLLKNLTRLGRTFLVADLL